MPPHYRRAFTLIEVLVSLTIFALAAVILSAAYLNVISGYQAQDRNREISEGWTLVRISVLAIPDREGWEQGGSINLADRSTVNWSVVIEPTTIADLFAVELTAETTGDQRWTKSARLMLLRPEWSDPTDRERLREESKQRLTALNAP